MKRTTRLLPLLLCAAVAASATAQRPAAPVSVVFDTDMDSDCDDAAALAMLHALAERGETRILATVVSSRHAWSAPAVDAINTYYGRPDLPIGVPERPERLTDFGSRYARGLAEEFAQDLSRAARVPTAVEVYRRVLAAQPDSSVVVVTVGDLTNLSDLLRSAPDAHSPLDGRALVARKVRRYVAMGSRYPADLDPRVWGNFKTDPASVVHVAAEWPTTITFTGGGDFANVVATGARLATEASARSPVRRAYELYFGGAPQQRHSADQIATLIAVRGAGTPWKLVTHGHNHVFPNGTHEWRTDRDDPRHEFVSALADGVDAEAVRRSIEDLMLHRPRR